MGPLDVNVQDPTTYKLLTALVLAWGIAFAIVLYGIAEDVIALMRGRKPRRRPTERRYREPCATDLHLYADDADSCSNCGADRPVEDAAQPS